MNVLVIYTHPHRKSLNGSFLQKTLDGLDHNKSVNQVDVLDLYKEGFNPLLVFNEDRKRRDMSKDPALRKYREQIKALTDKKAAGGLKPEQIKQIDKKLGGLRGNLKDVAKKRAGIVKRKASKKLKAANAKIQNAKDKSTIIDYTEKRGAKLIKKGNKKKAEAQKRLNMFK